MNIYKQIEEGESPYIIAEAGVNHNGDLSLAKKLVEVASEAGADAVKFQTFTAENVVTESTSRADYQARNTGRKESQLEMIKKFELKIEDFRKIKDYCDEMGITFLSTPHSPDVLEELDPLIPMYKVGSGDLTNIPFLREISRIGKPVILSTGMANMDEIREAVSTIRNEGNNKIIVLQCITNYPCDVKDVNLRVMNSIKETFNVLAGYSDHTLGNDATKLAVELGAKVIEKHFTLDKGMPGPDHKASADPRELKELIKAVKNRDFSISVDPEILLGSTEKKPTKEEKEISKVVRKSIVTNKRISKGEIITSDMLIVKRPGTGIKPKYIEDIIGKKASGDLPRDKVLHEDDFE